MVVSLQIESYSVDTLLNGGGWVFNIFRRYTFSIVILYRRKKRIRRAIESRHRSNFVQK